MATHVMATSRAPHDDVTVRWAEPRDAEAIRVVAERDSKRAPTGATLVAEVGGQIAAARSVGSEEETVADPFRPTSHLVDLLELRAAQIASRGQSKGRGVAALWLARHFLAGSRKRVDARAAPGACGAVSGGAPMGSMGAAPWPR
jgi:hypothetical protein